MMDATETIDYITYIKKGILQLKVMPVEVDIIINLKEAVTGLQNLLILSVQLK